VALILLKGGRQGNSRTTTTTLIAGLNLDGLGTYMGKTKTTTITSETHEVIIVRRPHGTSIRAWCQSCAREVEMISPEEAACASGTTTLAIYRRSEAGEIHFLETAEGALLICPNSIFSPRQLR
jgi:hypothetical protein